MGNFTNRLKIIGDYFFPSAKFHYFPQEVVIELTNHCNLECVMCPNSQMTREKGFMRWEVFKKIIDQVKGKSELVYLHGIGESMLHKDVIRYCNYASQNGLRTFLSTNGLPVSDRSAEELVTCGLDWLVIALDGGVKETYEKIRVKGDFDKLLHNIKRIIHYKKVHGTATRIVLQTIYMEENKGELEIFRNLFTREEKSLIYQFRFKPHCDTFKRYNQNVVHTRPCYWLWNMMVIAWNGDMQLCCMDYDGKYFKANIIDKDVGELWNAEALKNIRDKHKVMNYGGLEICNGCDIPEQGYFNNFTIIGCAFMNASSMRTLIPIYEKLLLLSRGMKG